MTTTELIVRGVIVKNDEILLCKNLKQGYYFLPGGHIEDAETPEEAFKREMVEELGIETQNVKQIAEVNNSYSEEGEDHTEVLYLYLATLEGYEKLKSLEGHIAFDWVSVSDLEKVDFRPQKITNNILTGISSNKDFWLT